jgi:hypothetical protein
MVRAGYKFIQNVIKNLEIFECEYPLFGQLRGFTDAEIQQLNAYYDHQLPLPVR